MMEDLPVSRNTRQRGAGGGGGSMMHPSVSCFMQGRGGDEELDNEEGVYPPRHVET